MLHGRTHSSPTRRVSGLPREPAALWLTEVGQPVRPNSWEVIFTRACKRCAQNGFPLSISPHQLRHAFAVHMLALLIQQRLREAALPVDRKSTRLNSSH